MGDLRTRSVLDDSLFNQGLSRMRGNAEAFSKRMAGAMMGFFAPAAILGGLTALGKSAMDNADKIQDMADRYKETAEDIQRVGNVARVMGTDIDSVMTSTKKLRLALVEAADGGREQNAALAAMGLRIQDLKGLALPELMVRISEGFKTAEASGRGVHSLVKLMGKSADEMVAILSQAPGELQAMFSASDVASNQAVASVAQVADAWQNLKDSLKSGSIEAAAGVVKVGKWIYDRMPGAEGRKQSRANIKASQDRMAAEAAESARNAPEPEKQFVAGEESASDRLDRESATNARLGEEWLKAEEERQQIAAETDAAKAAELEKARDEREAAIAAGERQHALEMAIAGLRGSSEQVALKASQMRVAAAQEELRLATSTADRKAKALLLAQAEAALADASSGEKVASKEDRIRGYLDQNMSLSQARRAVRVEDKASRKAEARKARYNRSLEDRPSLIDDGNRALVDDPNNDTRQGLMSQPIDAAKSAGKWEMTGMSRGGPEPGKTSKNGEIPNGEAAGSSGEPMLTALQNIEKAVSDMKTAIQGATQGS